MLIYECMQAVIVAIHMTVFHSKIIIAEYATFWRSI